MPPRAKPVQSMEACRLQSVRDACKFRDTFGNLTEDEKLAMMRNCFEIIGPELRACAAKQERLAGWIEAE